MREDAARQVLARAGSVCGGAGEAGDGGGGDVSAMLQNFIPGARDTETLENFPHATLTQC